MRIKSYFAASVQTAIGMARREFGDDVTLVTSHVAAPDARHLGEYEVVFAIEDEGQEHVAETVSREKQPVETVPVETVKEQSAPAPFTGFQEVLLEAVRPKATAADELEIKLERLRCALIDLGLEAAITAAVMTLVEKSLPANTATVRAAALSEAPAEREPDIEADMKAGRIDGVATVQKKDGALVVLPSGKRAHLSAAELCFLSSVAGSPGTEVARIK